MMNDGRTLLEQVNDGVALDNRFKRDTEEQPTRRRVSAEEFETAKREWLRLDSI